MPELFFDSFIRNWPQSLPGKPRDDMSGPRRIFGADCDKQSFLDMDYYIHESEVNYMTNNTAKDILFNVTAVNLRDPQ